VSGLFGVSMQHRREVAKQSEESSNFVMHCMVNLERHSLPAQAGLCGCSNHTCPVQCSRSHHLGFLVRTPKRVVGRGPACKRHPPPCTDARSNAQGRDSSCIQQHLTSTSYVDCMVIKSSVFFKKKVACYLHNALMTMQSSLQRSVVREPTTKASV
jgi:hypothetical protein